MLISKLIILKYLQETENENYTKIYNCFVHDHNTVIKGVKKMIKLPMARASERKISRGYEGRYRAPNLIAPQALSGVHAVESFFVRLV